MIEPEVVEQWWRNLSEEEKEDIANDYFSNNDDPGYQWFNLNWKQKLKIYKENKE